MNAKRLLYLIAAVMFISGDLLSSSAFAANSDSRPADHVWIDRPWNIRYLLLIDRARSMEIAAEVAAEGNAKAAKEGNLKDYRGPENLFVRTALVAIPSENPLATKLIEFDHHGRVITPNKHDLPLTGRLNQLNDLVLATSDSATDPLYLLAYWFWGLPGDEQLFSPAVCSLSDDHRYVKGFKAERFATMGNFGCREWTYQLYDRFREHPYIDVTSYQKDGTYIKEFIGWARFNDTPKPVIGKHIKTWVCLHDCPAGEAPGVIPDIKAWAKKHGFPLPKRPKKQPMFPNKDFAHSYDE